MPTRLTPLRIDSLEPKPKRIWKARSFRDLIRIEQRSDLMVELVTIQKRVVSGSILPQRFYRSGRGRTPDRLLDEDAIMHLHLGNPGTPELLFLRQYDDHVVLLELSNHYHFDYDPPGTALLQLHQAAMVEWEDAREKDAEKLRSKVGADLRRRLSPPVPTPPSAPSKG